MYETDSVPSSWVERLNRMDHVWVPTNFHLDTFSRAGVHLEKLSVLPESVDTAFYDPQNVETPFLSFQVPPQKYVFLSVLFMCDK